MLKKVQHVKYVLGNGPKNHHALSSFHFDGYNFLQERIQVSTIIRQHCDISMFLTLSLFASICAITNALCYMWWTLGDPISMHFLMCPPICFCIEINHFRHYTYTLTTFTIFSSKVRLMLITKLYLKKCFLFLITLLIKLPLHPND